MTFHLRLMVPMQKYRKDFKVLLDKQMKQSAVFSLGNAVMKQNDTRQILFY